PQGWHRQSRTAASFAPDTTPCSRMASIAYCEQVGVKRQPKPMGPSAAVKTGEMAKRYRRSAANRAFCSQPVSLVVPPSGGGAPDRLKPALRTAGSTSDVECSKLDVER